MRYSRPMKGDHRAQWSRWESQCLWLRIIERLCIPSTFCWQQWVDDGLHPRVCSDLELGLGGECAKLLTCLRLSD